MSFFANVSVYICVKIKIIIYIEKNEKYNNSVDLLLISERKDNNE